MRYWITDKSVTDVEGRKWSKVVEDLQTAHKSRDGEHKNKYKITGALYRNSTSEQSGACITKSKRHYIYNAKTALTSALLFQYN